MNLHSQLRSPSGFHSGDVVHALSPSARRCHRAFQRDWWIRDRSSGLGSAVASIGFSATILTLNGLVFHKLLSRHGYPHVPMAPLPNLHGTADPPPRSRSVSPRRTSKPRCSMSEKRSISIGKISHACYSRLKDGLWKGRMAA